MKHTSNHQLNSNERQNFLADSHILQKSLEDLNLMDSFLLDAATEDPENAKKIAKVIIERATGHVVENLVVEIEKQLKGLSIDKRGIRMDIYVREQEQTENGYSTLCLYDIEPNKYQEKDLPRRSRFYQSLIDAKLIPTNTSFEKLPDVITIWILPYDPFGCDRMVYTVKNMVTEENHIVYNDGVTKLFLYTKGTKGGSKDLKDLLTYMEHTTLESAVDKDLQEIQGIVNTIKERRETKERYMTLQEMINYEKRDSYKEGLVDGELKGEIKGSIHTCKSLNQDKSHTKTFLMDQYSISEDKAEEYLNLYWNLDTSK